MNLFFISPLGGSKIINQFECASIDGESKFVKPMKLNMKYVLFLLSRYCIPFVQALVSSLFFFIL